MSLPILEVQQKFYSDELDMNLAQERWKSEGRISGRSSVHSSACPIDSTWPDLGFEWLLGWEILAKMTAGYSIKCYE